MRRRQLIGWAGLAALGACRTRAGTPELWIGGDVHVGDGPHDDPGERLAPLANVVGGALGVVNLEGPVGGPAAARPSSPLRLHNPPSALPALRAAGVAVVGIANNHALDLGEAGAVATVSALRGAGLKVSGGAEAAVLHHAGRRTAVTAHDLSSRVPPSMAGDLARARAAADDLVATLHVTGPPSYLPRAELRTAVGLSLAAGARVVAAHGTHALGPVERRGQAVVAWGLGNLLFSCDCTEERDAAILRVALAPDRVHAAVFPIDAGLFGQSARLARDADLSFDLLRAIGSSPLTRFGSGASF